MESYRPQLDALRAIAVLGVLANHLLVPGMLGHFGVHLFFVLSGFLITTILLDAKPDEARLRTIGPVIRNFIVRRILRIWPAYYLVMAALLAANVPDFRPVAPWHMLFGSNLLFALRDDYVPWWTSALWSLSVEEQFYLLWPFIILWCRRPMLPWIVSGTIIVGYAWKIALADDSSLGALHLPPAAMDALGAGAGLALIGDGIHRWKAHYPAILVTSIALTGLALFVAAPGPLVEAIALVGMVAAVAGAATGFTGVTGWLFDRRLLHGVGRISYGIYLYHLFVLAIVLRLLGDGSVISRYSPAMFAIVGSITLVVATASWFLIERPANTLKRYFPMAPRPQPNASVTERTRNHNATATSRD